MKKKQTVIKIFLTYVLVLLPLLLVNFAVTSILLKNIKTKEQAQIDIQMRALADALNQDIIQYSDKSISLLQLELFSANKIQHDPAAQWEAIAMLRRFRLFDNRVNEILVYYGGEYLYGNNGITSPEVYFQTTLKLFPESVSDAIEALTSSDSVAVILEGTTGSKYILYHIPVGRKMSVMQRSVQYVFHAMEFAPMLDSYLDSTGLLVEISFGDHAVYFQTHENIQETSGCTAISKEEFLSNISEHVFLEKEITGNIASVRIWYDEMQHIHEYRTLRDMTTLVLVFGVFITTTITAALTGHRMRGIEQLANRIRGKKTSKSQSRLLRINEFDYIQALIDESIRNSNSNIEKACGYRHMLLQHVSMMIFQGILREWDEIQSILLVCGTELCEEYFFLCGIRLERPEDAQALEAYICEDVHFYTDSQSVIVMCSLVSYDYDQRLRKNIAKGFLNSLESVGIQCNQVVMSQVYNPISLANYAYLEIISIWEHVKDDNNRIICWEDLVTQQDKHNFRINNNDLQVFFQAVEQKNRQQAGRIIDRIFIREAHDKSEEYMRYMRYMVIQAIRLGMHALDEQVTHGIQQRLSSLETEETPAFVDTIKAILKDYCSEPDDMYRKIIDYVNDNFCRYDLSLEQLAQEANVSKSQMSKIFHMLTGSGYIDYVTNLRMEKARELLATTNLGVKDIFIQVGYIDSANASKKFKAIYDITPSAYREQMKRNTDKEEI